MTAVDTNVLVRLLTGDDAEQAAGARAVFAEGPVWIAKTVMLEAEWVLRSAYGFERSPIREAFTGLLGLSNVQVEDQATVVRALELMRHGVDFADALHLNSRPAGVPFVSFDKAFIRRAKRAGAKGVAAPPTRLSH